MTRRGRLGEEGRGRRGRLGEEAGAGCCPRRAHCMVNVEKEDLRVLVGDHNLYTISNSQKAIKVTLQAQAGFQPCQ